MDPLYKAWVEHTNPPVRVDLNGMSKNFKDSVKELGDHMFMHMNNMGTETKITSNAATNTDNLFTYFRREGLDPLEEIPVDLLKGPGTPSKSIYEEEDVDKFIEAVERESAKKQEEPGYFLRSKAKKGAIESKGESLFSQSDY